MLTRHSDYIAHLDGYTVIPGGWVNHHWVQLGYQLADSLAGGGYSFAATCIILGCIDGVGRFVPLLKLRASDDEEVLGIDDIEIGEFAVRFLLLSRLRRSLAQYDYVELTRDLQTPDGAGDDARSLDHEKTPGSVDPAHRVNNWAAQPSS